MIKKLFSWDVDRNKMRRLAECIKGEKLCFPACNFTVTKTSIIKKGRVFELWVIEQ